MAGKFIRWMVAVAILLQVVQTRPTAAFCIPSMSLAQERARFQHPKINGDRSGRHQRLFLPITNALRESMLTERATHGTFLRAMPEEVHETRIIGQCIDFVTKAASIALILYTIVIVKFFLLDFAVYRCIHPM